MVTWRLSHRIESLGDDEVGSGVDVDVGSGVCATVDVTELDCDSLFAVQAVSMMSPNSNVRDAFLNRNMVNSVLF